MLHIAFYIARDRRHAHAPHLGSLEGSVHTSGWECCLTVDDVAVYIPEDAESGEGSTVLSCLPILIGFGWFVCSSTKI